MEQGVFQLPILCFSGSSTTRMLVSKLYRYCRLINSKQVPVADRVYNNDSTDTMVSFIVGDRQYHLFDGTSNIWEMLKNLIGWGSRKRRQGAFYSYDKTAENLFKKIKFDTSKQQVYFGISRGGGVAMDVLTEYMEKHNDNVVLCTNVMPPAGGKHWVEYCKSLGFEHLRIRVKGDIVPRIPAWGKHYETRLITLKTKKRGLLSKHLAGGDNLGELEI